MSFEWTDTTYVLLTTFVAFVLVLAALFLIMCLCIYLKRKGNKSLSVLDGASADVDAWRFTKDRGSTRTSTEFGRGRSGYDMAELEPGRPSEARSEVPTVNFNIPTFPPDLYYPSMKVRHPPTPFPHSITKSHEVWPRSPMYWENSTSDTATSTPSTPVRPSPQSLDEPHYHPGSLCPGTPRSGHVGTPHPGTPHPGSRSAERSQEYVPRPPWLPLAARQHLDDRKEVLSMRRHRSLSAVDTTSFIRKSTSSRVFREEDSAISIARTLTSISTMERDLESSSVFFKPDTDEPVPRIPTSFVSSSPARRVSGLTAESTDTKVANAVAPTVPTEDSKFLADTAAMSPLPELTKDKEVLLQDDNVMSSTLTSPAAKARKSRPSPPPRLQIPAPKTAFTTVAADSSKTVTSAKYASGAESGEIAAAAARAPVVINGMLYMPPPAREGGASRSHGVDTDRLRRKILEEARRRTEEASRVSPVIPLAA